MQPNPATEKIEQILAEKWSLASEEPEPRPEGSAWKSYLPEEELLKQIVADMARMEAGPATCDDERTLQRYQRLRARCLAERQRIVDSHRQMVARCDSELSTIDYLYAAEAEAACRRLIEGSSKKSLITPFGKAGFRTNPARLEVVDEPRVPSQFKRQVVTEKIDKRAIDVQFTASGEIPPGCELVPPTEKFYSV